MQAAVADVTVGSSPAWMQARLQAAGVRPISNIVDVTNYVLLEMGQPMHAFDFTKLGRVRRYECVRRNRGESITTLDGQTRELSGDMLVIADAERPVAIAGVMGGAESEVSEGTTAIVFESAYFNPLSVRRTSRKLALKTEASMRFERGLDARLPLTAMERACALLETIGAGKARGTVVDRYPSRIEPRTVRLRRDRIQGLLGTVVPDADMKRILESLGFTLRDPSAATDAGSLGAGAGWEVTVPTRRVDIAREVDLIEEVARHYGFDKLPSTFPALTSAPPPVDPRIGRARHLRAVMTAAGFFEAMTFGFVASAAAAPFAPEGDLVPIANPLSENFAVLRPSALPSLVDAVAHNRRREQRDVRLFEIGARFSRSAGERRSIACAWTGAASGEHWTGGARDVDFFDMKGVVERIGDALRLKVTTGEHREPWLASGPLRLRYGERRSHRRHGPARARCRRSARVAGERRRSTWLKSTSMPLKRWRRRTNRASSRWPRYPSVTRDISILIDAALASGLRACDRPGSGTRHAHPHPRIRIAIKARACPKGKSACRCI
jgi:phenylalanyl-tRNA synthetase beta chain